MGQELRADAVVIGAGPGGYPCAIRLGQLGKKAIVVEKEFFGGVCLNVGCIPSKALIHAAKTYDKLAHAADMGIVVSAPPSVDMKAMQAWKAGIVDKLTSGVRQLLKANGAEGVKGTASVQAAGADGYAVTVTAADGSSSVIKTKNVVVATGSRPIEIPGFAFDGKRILDSTGGLALDAVPKRLVVVGGGYIGLELGTVFAKLGSKVTVLEALDTILTGIDKECVALVARKLRKMGVEVVLGAKAVGWEEKGDRAVVKFAKGSEQGTLDADKVLVTVGRRPNSAGLGLEALGVAVEKGFVKVDAQQRTNVPGIYAIGDVAGGALLAHKATREGEVAAEVIAGHKTAMDARVIPAVVFTDPEIATAGMTEDDAAKAGRKVKSGKFPFAALGRALSVNDTDGFAKVVADEQTGELLGVHVVGNGASDMISEASLAIEMGAVLYDLALTVHPHPTLPEAVMEAAKVVLGEAIHVVNR